jgi:hypothetical protein
MLSHQSHFLMNPKKNLDNDTTPPSSAIFAIAIAKEKFGDEEIVPALALAAMPFP